MARVDPKLFLQQFNKADLKNKLQLVASVPAEEIKDLFPQIKNSLLNAKHSPSLEPKNKEIAFLLDKIEVDIEIYNQNYIEAISILENCLRHHSLTINDSLKCYSMLKNIFVRTRNINKAFDMHYLIEKNWNKKSNSAQIDFGEEKSTLYHMIGLTDLAIAERRLEGKKSNLENDANGYPYLYNDLGVFYNAKKESDSAAFYFMKAKEILLKKKKSKKEENQYNFFLALIDGNLALSYFNKGKIIEAIPLLKTDVYYSLKDNQFESAFNSYNLLTKCYINLKQTKLAKAYLDSSQMLLKEKVRGITPKLKLILTSADYYNSINNYYTSNLFYKQYRFINDSFQLIEKELSFKNQRIASSVEQSEFALAEKDKLIAQSKYEEAKQKTFKAYLLAGVIVLSTVIIFLILNNRNSKTREEQLYSKNKRIRAQNALIEQSLKEKEALIKEIHHRVKNNLQIVSSLLSLQIGKVDDNTTTEIILKDAQRRINAISLTHQMLYPKNNISSSISLGIYVEDLVRQIESTIFSNDIVLNISIQPSETKINIDTAVPLGLMINEILTNAYKHAFLDKEKGIVSVSLSDISDGCILKISDNGKGLPENFESLNQKSMGMELIHILAEQLNAILNIERINGTTFIIKMKL